MQEDKLGRGVKAIATLCIALAAGCQSSASSPRPETATVVDVGALRAMLDRAFQSRNFALLEQDPVAVKARLDLSAGGQQFLWLQEEQEDLHDANQCLQLILPAEVRKSADAGKLTATVEGTLLLLGNKEDAIYTKFTVQGVEVYPYCNAYPGIYLLVKSITP